MIAANDHHRERQKGDKEQVGEYRPSVGAIYLFRTLLATRAPKPEGREDQEGDNVGL
jgi:hypothetical protein